jgi:hypothetical protein
MRARWVVLTAVLGLLAGAGIAVGVQYATSGPGYAARIEGYRLEGPSVLTFLVTLGIGERVEIELTDGTDTVTVIARTQGGGNAPSIGLSYWITGSLYTPVGNRRVVDHTGAPIGELLTPPPYERRS